MEERFCPRARLLGSLTMKQVCNGPEMLAGMMEVQNVNGLTESVLGDVPEPDRAIDDDVNSMGSAQAPPPSFCLHRRAKVHRFSVRRFYHDVLLDQHPSPRRLFDALLQPVNNGRFDFFPIHPLGFFFTLAGSPIDTALARQPPVHHEHQGKLGFPSYWGGLMAVHLASLAT